MDERLQKALEFGNYSQTIANQKQNIKNRVQQMCTVHCNNGMFVANQQTIAFVKALVDLKINTSIIEDSKQNPIEIKNTCEFLDALVSAYSAAMTEYNTEYSKLKKIRKLEKLME